MPSPIGPVPMMRREQAPAGMAEDGTPRLPSSNLVQEPHPFQIRRDGAWVYDIEKYKQAAAAAGVAVESDPFFKVMSETNQLRQETQAKAGVQAKEKAGLLLGMPDAQLMQNAPAAVNGLRGLYNDDVLDSFMALHKSGDVPQVRAALGRLAGAKYETPVVPGQTLQSQFGDTQVTPGTTPVQIEGNPFPMMENGQLVSAVRVKTANGGSEFRHVDGVTPFAGTLTGMPGKQEDVMRNGRRTPILEGTRQVGDLPVPTPQAFQAPSWDVLTDPTGTRQRYVAKGSQEAADLMQQGWKAGGSGPALRGVMSSDANRLSDFDTSLDDTDVLRTVIGDTGTIARIGASMPTWVTELTGGWGADAKSRNAVIARVKQVIGKALEGGVLRKEDEEKYKDILPTIGDTEAVALSKINGLEAAIVLRKSRLIDSLDDAGYDMQRFRARPVRVPGQTVKMRSPGPDGAIKDVPAGMVEHYKSLGATVVGP